MGVTGPVWGLVNTVSETSPYVRRDKNSRRPVGLHDSSTPSVDMYVKTESFLSQNSEQTSGFCSRSLDL